MWSRASPARSSRWRSSGSRVAGRAPGSRWRTWGSATATRAGSRRASPVSTRLWRSSRSLEAGVWKAAFWTTWLARTSPWAATTRRCDVARRPWPRGATPRTATARPRPLTASDTSIRPSAGRSRRGGSGAGPWTSSRSLMHPPPPTSAHSSRVWPGTGRRPVLGRTFSGDPVPPAHRRESADIRLGPLLRRRGDGAGDRRSGAARLDPHRSGRPDVDVAGVRGPAVADVQVVGGGAADADRAARGAEPGIGDLLGRPPLPAHAAGEEHGAGRGDVSDLSRAVGGRQGADTGCPGCRVPGVAGQRRRFVGQAVGGRVLDVETAVASGVEDRCGARYRTRGVRAHGRTADSRAGGLAQRGADASAGRCDTGVGQRGFPPLS